MSGSTSFEPVSLTNNLDTSVILYDSFSSADRNNYFGTLTPLATIPGKTTVAVRPIREFSVWIASNAAADVLPINLPLARLSTSRLFGTTPSAVTQANVKDMLQTMDFIAFNIKYPGDPMSEAFMALLKSGPKDLVGSIDNFFPQYAAYANCTFVTYMMGIAYIAMQPASKAKPLSQAIYSLSALVKMLGGDWPTRFPDIAVTNFTCTSPNDMLTVHADIEVNKLPAQTDEALNFFASLFRVKVIHFAINFNYGMNLGFLGTRLSASLDAMQVPCGGTDSLTITKPTVTIDINPLFKFVVFTVKGGMPFTILGKSFEADVAMTIDNIQANFGVVIKGDHGALPAPSGVKGVHFDEFGVGIGVLFEPPSLAIGLSGKMHVGQPDGFSVALDDNTYAVVCSLVEEVPNPLYISFYVPHMEFGDVLTVFTDKKVDLDVPVSFTNMSFQWSENPMMPVALPDGSLSKMGYGFSAAVNILAFSFYGDVTIDLNNGVKGDVEMGPLSLGHLFAIGGSGKGITIKVDANGSPIKNNQVVTKADQKLAIQSAKNKQLVAPGGPILKLQTFSSPFLIVNAHVSLFDNNIASIDASITKSGITFDLNYGVVLSTRMSCTLSDWHNLAATFAYGIDRTIQLPFLRGVNLGSIHLQAMVHAHLSLSTSTSELILRIGGGFFFQDMHRTFGDFTVDVNIQNLTDLLSAIADYIESEASRIFDDIINTAQAWASKVKNGIITTEHAVANVLHRAYNQAATEVASTMKAVGFPADDIASQLKQIFDPSQVADALKNVFNLSEQGVAAMMQQVGFAGEEVASALKNTFGDNAVAIADALHVGFGWDTDQIRQTLDEVGFSAGQIGDAFRSLGGVFASAGDGIAVALDPVRGCAVM